MLSWPFAIVLVLLEAFSALGYTLVPPYDNEAYTEFYLLGPDGKAANYPTKLTIGEVGTVITGIVNHENEGPASALM